jgi:hypothetical protein
MKLPFYRVSWRGDEASTAAGLPQAFFGSLEVAQRKARELAKRYEEVTVERVDLAVLHKRALLLAALNGLAIDQATPVLKYTSETCERCAGFDEDCQERVKIQKVMLL